MCKRVKEVYIIIFSLALLLNLSIWGADSIVTNSLKEIENCEGKIKLGLVRVWGGDDTEDENQFFRLPHDIKIGADKLVYIVDTGNNRIQVFDRSSNFKRTIGRKGQGPGDLLSPTSIALDRNNNINTTDNENFRVQTFSPQGNYLSSFKTMANMPSFVTEISNGNIAVYCYSRNFKTRSIISLYTHDGKFIKDIGKHNDRSKMLIDHESLVIAPDKTGGMIVAYCATPYFQKISFNGDVLLTVIYDVPFNAPVIKQTDSSGHFEIVGKRIIGICNGLATDNEGQVYMATTTRSKNKNEIIYLVSEGAGAMIRYPKKVETDKTDRFKLLVFNPAGKVIAAAKLNVFCDNIYIHDKSLFIIDSYMGMKIYEYNIHFK
jgi:hypothetical protein